MARNAVKPFGEQNIFSGKLLRLIDPTPHLWLRDFEVTRHLAVTPRLITAEDQRFISGHIFTHEDYYTFLNRTVNTFVECAAIHFRIGVAHG